jgi:beta-N-acetylhexosaminidase
MKPAIFGVSATVLTEDERRLFKDADPAGYILFKRNVENRAQLRALTDSLRELSGRDDLPILIDQEGGRVTRLPSPEWSSFPAGAAFDALYDASAMSAIEAARLNAEAVALTLIEVGVNVNCMPILDVREPQTAPAIGDRALGSDAMRVAALGRAILSGMASGGVAGVIKHMPGHGRACVDSHHEMPLVAASRAELERDLAPFRALSSAPFGMTCHVVYQAYDPDHCATMSPAIIADVIRGEIGFDGLLMSDDLEMSALSGSFADRAEGCIAAGCDVALFCSGKLNDMIAIADRLPEISDMGRQRLQRAMATIITAAANPDRIAALEAKRDALLAISVSIAETKYTHAATGAA